jgi:delta24-sterol reductase
VLHKRYGNSLFKLPVKTTVYPELGFEEAHRQGDTEFAQMYTDVGIYYTPAPVFRGEAFDGAEAVWRMEKWLIENHGFQPQYAVSELNERDFWCMFDGSLYNSCREKYRAVGTFMSVYYKSKKGRKTEKEVREEEQKQLDNAYAELDQPVME